MAGGVDIAADRRLCGRPRRGHASNQLSRDLYEKLCLLVVHIFLINYVYCVQAL